MLGVPKPFLAPLLLTAGISLAAGETGRLGGSSETRFSESVEGRKLNRYFENWTDLSYEQGAYRLDVGYEAHLPPAPASRDTAGQGIYQRTFTFRKDGLTFKAGNYFSKLGNGLTLVAERNRDIGFNTNLDGFYGEYGSQAIEIKALLGSPRDAAGRRYPALQAGEFRYSAMKGFLGATFVTTRTTEDDNDYWGSAYFGVNGEHSNIQVEWAARRFAENHGLHRVAEDYGSVFPEGKAVYASGNLSLGKFSLFLEGRHYQDFNLFEGAIYNNPPAGIKEHVFSFPNNHQLVQNADNERGVHFSLDFPLREENTASFDYSKTVSINGDHDLYEEFHAQIDLDGSLPVTGVAAIGHQTDLESRNFNFILHTGLPLGERYALKAEWQHQHTTILLTDRMFYGDQFILGLERSPNLVLCVIAEASTDQLESSPLAYSQAKLWTGFQVNWNFLKHHHLTAFLGTRKKGKVCAGGICILKPAMQGVELALASHF